MRILAGSVASLVAAAVTVQVAVVVAFPCIEELAMCD